VAEELRVDLRHQFDTRRVDLVLFGYPDFDRADTDYSRLIPREVTLGYHRHSPRGWEVVDVTVRGVPRLRAGGEGDNTKTEHFIRRTGLGLQRPRETWPDWLRELADQWLPRG
jgi:hypothetical protein